MFTVLLIVSRDRSEWPQPPIYPSEQDSQNELPIHHRGALGAKVLYEGQVK